MFERYTERARRVLFFARYEASQLGSLSIETEHLLLGLMREGKGLIGRILGRAHLSPENVRREVEGRTVFREKVSTSVEIPFSAETKRVLGYAAEEADRLLHNYIGTEHLLLGLLREERSVAASILMDKGMRLHTVREDIVQLLNDKSNLETFYEPGSHRDDRSSAPRFLPSRTVHIAYNTTSRGHDASIEEHESAWGAYNVTLRQIVAFAWEVDVAHVRLDSPREHDESMRYDFMIALPQTDGPDVIPGLLREAIQKQLDVDVTREDTDPLTIVVKPR
jgi:ATP-dependent Clp protease ATP-binding subunit ClpA